MVLFKVYSNAMILPEKLVTVWIIYHQNIVIKLTTISLANNNHFLLMNRGPLDSLGDFSWGCSHDCVLASCRLS